MSHVEMYARYLGGERGPKIVFGIFEAFVRDWPNKPTMISRWKRSRRKFAYITINGTNFGIPRGDAWRLAERLEKGVGL